MGEVYEAEDLSLGLRVALKTIPKELAEDPKALERFKREIKLSRQVSHPNICRIHDLFSHTDTENGEMRRFLTMELLEGESLSEKIRRAGKMSASEALPIVRQLVAGLRAAHEAGVIHRDLKADNIFLVPEEGGESRAVIMDFGLAKSFDRSGEETQTLTRGWVGTPAYVAPEQIRGLAPEAASDIYSLGIVMYEMVTGERPFEGPDPISTAVQRLVEDPSSPSDIVPNLDPAWERCILWCLKRDPKARPGQVEDVLEILEGRKKEPGKRWRWWVYASIPLLLSIAFLVWWQTMPRAARPSVAILGFNSLNEDEKSDWLGAALSEMLSTELAAPGVFRLIPAEDVAEARIELGMTEGDKLTGKRLEELSRILGADWIMDGGYLQLPGGKGDSLRLDLKFRSSGKTSSVIAVGVQGDASDLFAVLREAGRKTFEAFGVSREAAPGGSSAAFPENKRALALYSQGVDKLRAFMPMEARELLEKAVELEPDFPLAHAALARCWMRLGYSGRAREESRIAFEGSEKLGREMRLGIEALFHENKAEWEEAIRLYRALWTFYPDNPGYALELAEAQLSSGSAQDAAKTLVAIRKAGFTSTDARIDLLEAKVRKANSDIHGQRDLAARAADEALKSGARLLYGRARLTEAKALWILGEKEEAKTALEDAGRVFGDFGDRQGQVETLVSSGVFARDQGEISNAGERFRKAVEMARSMGDLREEFSARRLLGEILLTRGKLEDAEAEFKAAAEISGIRGDRQAGAIIAGRLALIQRKGGKLEEARRSYQKSYRELLALGMRTEAASAATSIAIVLRLQGRPDEAIDLLKESLRLKREAGERRAMTVSLVNLGNLAFDLGRLDEAESYYHQALDLAREFGNTRHQAYALFGLAEIARERNRLEESRRDHLEALRLRRKAGGAPTIAASLMALAQLDVDRKDLPTARREAEEALGLFSEESSSSLKQWARMTLARVCIAEGDLKGAQDSIKGVMEDLGDGSDESLQMFFMMTRAMAARAAGDLKLARNLLAECLQRAENSRQKSAEIESLIRLGLVERELGLGEGEEHLRKAEAEARRGGFLSLLAMLPSGSD